MSENTPEGPDTTEAKKRKEEEDSARRRAYEAVYAEHNRREASMAESYDKSILTYATGALALSVTFMKDLVPLATASNMWLLRSSWIGFALAILCVVGSYPVGTFGARRDLIKIGNILMTPGAQDDGKRSRLGLWAMGINIAAGTFFFAGMALLAVFACINVGAVTMNDKKTPTTPVSNTTGTVSISLDSYPSISIPLVSMRPPVAPQAGGATPAAPSQSPQGTIQASTPSGVPESITPKK